MECFITFTNQSQGRDRIFRAAQYGSALFVYLLKNKSGRQKLIKKLQSLESNMSTGRKLFRLGNTVSSIDAAKRTMHLEDPMLRLCLTVANLNRSLYFLCDNILWARSIGLVTDMDKEKWSVRASRCYFVSLLMNLTRDLYGIYRAMEREAQDKQYRQKVSQHCSDSRDVACMAVLDLQAFLLLLYHSLRRNPSILLDTAKNVCDLFIPMDRLGIYKTNPGVVGLCGLMSSILGILALVKPSFKLKP
ncbi:peroxisomal membrane protein 11A-like [Acipenser ruthenus]|uniref:peroxisomal membrane protein 11A-like n=1 Tax=Acipenser ruthenus TaxID=7906 RepID=UPI00145BBC0E|nr:peroxisomal membrane protein 11A-like [Acipenser ruthenus]